MSINEALLQQETVKRVLPNGDGVISVQTISGQGLADGKSFTPATTNSKSLLEFSPLGEFVKAVKLPAIDKNVPALGRILGEGILSSHGVFLPLHPVRNGDTWRRVFNVRVNGKMSRSVVNSRLVGSQRVGLYNTRHVHAVLAAPLAFNMSTRTGKAVTSQHVTGLIKIVYDANVAPKQGIVVRMAAYGKLWMKLQTSTHGTHPASDASEHLVLTIQLGSDMVD